MLTLEIQGYGKAIKVENLVFDFNGTLAIDGKISEATSRSLKLLHESGFRISVLTADTFGTVMEQCQGLPVEVRVFDQGNAEESKREIVASLGAERTAAIGNGRNDVAMLKEASVGIAVVGGEGAYTGLFQVADIAVTSIEAAIELFLNPKRIEATLRK